MITLVLSSADEQRVDAQQLYPGVGACCARRVVRLTCTVTRTLTIVQYHIIPKSQTIVVVAVAVTVAFHRQFSLY